MLNPDLINQTDILYQSFGGYTGVWPAVQDDLKLVDTVLFNGNTIVATPFSDISEKDGTTLLPIPLIDLRDYGYQVGTKYAILNDTHNIVYEEVLEPTIINGELNYYWGVGDNAQGFIQNALHGSRWFMHFVSKTGSKIIQILVCKQLNPIEYEVLLKEWRAQQGKEIKRENEIFIYANEEGEGILKVFSLAGGEKSLLSEINIVLNGDVTEHPLSTTLYLTPNRDTWYHFRTYNNFNLGYSVVNESIENAESTLGGDGYELIKKYENPLEYGSLWLKENKEIRLWYRAVDDIVKEESTTEYVVKSLDYVSDKFLKSRGSMWFVDIHSPENAYNEYYNKGLMSFNFKSKIASRVETNLI